MLALHSGFLAEYYESWRKEPVDSTPFGAKIQEACFLSQSKEPLALNSGKSCQCHFQKSFRVGTIFPWKAWKKTKDTHRFQSTWVMPVRVQTSWIWLGGKTHRPTCLCAPTWAGTWVSRVSRSGNCFFLGHVFSAKGEVSLSDLWRFWTDLI